MLKWPFPPSVKQQILSRISLMIGCLQVLFAGLLVSLLTLGFINHNMPEPEEENRWFCGTVDPMGDFFIIVQELEGYHLFMNHCHDCHTLGDEILVGPGLRDIFLRRDTVWVRKFIQDSQKMIRNGDAYAQHLFIKYNQNICPSYQSETKEEGIEELIRFLQAADTLISSY